MSDPLRLTVPTPDEVHVWWIDLSATRDGADTILSAEERARAARFRRQRDRERWTRAHAAVRHILGGYLRVPPQDVRFTAEAIPGAPIPLSPGATREGTGKVRTFRVKPALLDDSRLRFNLAHSADRAALAVAVEREVGIDLERIDADLDPGPLLAIACSPAETARIEALPDGQRVEAFLRLWTAKEAYLKAVGVGLFREPRTLEVEILADGRAHLHDARAENASSRCDVRYLDAGPGWVATLAVVGSGLAVRTFAWPLASDAPSRRVT